MIRKYDVTLAFKNPDYPRTPARQDIVWRVEAHNPASALDKAMSQARVSWTDLFTWSTKEAQS